MDKIYLKNIKIYAYHGCMEEEKKIGSDYLVNLIVHADLSLSCDSDELKDTVDYVALLDVVKSQMKMRVILPIEQRQPLLLWALICIQGDRLLHYQTVCQQPRYLLYQTQLNKGISVNL